MSGWCQAASARWPTVLITISVPFQLLVLYLRRIQPSSRYQCGSSCLSRSSTSASRVSSLRRCHRGDLLKQCGVSPLASKHIAEASSQQWTRPCVRAVAQAPARRRSRRDQVSVTTTARLHFGFLDPSGRGTRPFGSFGLAHRPAEDATDACGAAATSSVTGARLRAGRRPICARIAASFGLATSYAFASRRGDPAACRPRLRHAARACHRVGLSPHSKACRLDPHEIAARLGPGQAVRHRHRHLRARRCRARRRSRRQANCRRCSPPPLPARLARAVDLRSGARPACTAQRRPRPSPRCRISRKARPPT